jgi:hypothetical protein
MSSPSPNPTRNDLSANAPTRHRKSPNGNRPVGDRAGVTETDLRGLHVDTRSDDFGVLEGLPSV